MATFKYPYTVKANGKIIPPNTEVLIDDAADAENINAEKAPEKKRTARKKA